MFPATQVAKTLGYANPQQAIRTHCKGVSEISTPTNGGTQKINYIPEGDVWRLIVRSKLPSAQRYEAWIMEEVLPSIRRTGQYNLSNEDNAALKIIKASTTEDRALAISEYRQIITAPYVAQLEAQKPKVDFADCVSVSDNCVDFGTFAKYLNDNNIISIGRNRLFELLREKKVLMKNNVPYQKFINAGIFNVVEKVIDRPGQPPITHPQTYIIGKGQVKLTELIKKQMESNLVS